MASGISTDADITELFSYITRYKPHTIELDATLKPFIPELIPSIGEVNGDATICFFCSFFGKLSKPS